MSEVVASGLKTPTQFIAEVEKIVDSWALAMDGNLMAMSHIMNWMEGFQYFLEDCLNKRDNQ